MSQSKTWPYVVGFAYEMEKKLAENRHKGDREGWVNVRPRALLTHLKEEVAELEDALDRWEDGPVDVRREAADVANMAMMVADAAVGIEPIGPIDQSGEQIVTMTFGQFLSLVDGLLAAYSEMSKLGMPILADLADAVADLEAVRGTMGPAKTSAGGS